ncbi:O-acetylhomoserine-lyase [Linderina pennispora]|uniref:O-acetylhomoserine-lyase n=1 Tax=Linderina pennispora TaxID=61395 RepID=A0A1Y1W051_9FUNG|nr:O-acetylhomoserine-lyase [Linderina pennispora]ORX66474.1 O-acetylhomoserine-lyase [Linderina pennispora]
MTQTGHSYHFDTLTVHAGQTPDTATNSRVAPIYQTASFVNKTEHFEQIFKGQRKGYVYSRTGNPTNETFEKRMAILENGYSAIATSSGTAANFMVFTVLCSPGDNIVMSNFVFGGTLMQARTSLPRLGIDARMVPSVDPEVLEEFVDENTKGVFVESISNPMLSVPDFEQLAAMAHRHGIPLVVDNTCGMGGYVVRPLDHGADIVTHSATKWINGHGTTLGGVVIDKGSFDWGSGKFPTLNEPSVFFGNKGAVDFANDKGSSALTLRLKAEAMRDFGMCMTPFAAWNFLLGLETLVLRAERQNSNAMGLAKWLVARDEVAWVSYIGLNSHPYYKNAAKYLRNGFGGVLCFGVKGGKQASVKCLDALKLVSVLANLGCAMTIAALSVSTSHYGLTEEELEQCGVRDDQIRVSLGIEKLEDIQADFAQALEKSQVN